MNDTDALLRQIMALPPERVAEIEDFVAFIASREADRGLTRAASVASTPAFQAIWDNQDDAAYDELSERDAGQLVLAMREALG